VQLAQFINNFHNKIQEVCLVQDLVKYIFCNLPIFVG